MSVLLQESRALPLQWPPEAKAPHLVPTSLSTLPVPSPVHCFQWQCPMGRENRTGPSTWGLRKPPPTPFMVQSVWPSPPRAGLDSCATSLAWAVILSAEALAQRRARQAAEQLSQEQRALVQTLLGARSRHLGSVFHQFVLFKVRLRGLGLERGPQGAGRLV